VISIARTVRKKYMPFPAMQPEVGLEMAMLEDDVTR
jgi:hypothetical protein